MTISFTNEQLQTILSALEDRLTKLTYMRKVEEFSLHYDDETNKAIALADEIYSFLETYKEEKEYLETKFERSLL